MRTAALIKRILLQITRDKRTLALLFVAPLLVLTLMHFMFNSEARPLALAAYGVPPALSEELEQLGVEVTPLSAPATGFPEEGEFDGLLQMENGSLALTLLNMEPSRSKALQAAIGQSLVSSVTRPLRETTGATGPAMEISHVYGDAETTFFDTLSPVLVGFFVFFFVFLISGIGLLRERTTGTLDRLMSTPIRRREVIIGYLSGYGILAVIQTVIVVSFSILVLDVVLVGSIWLVLLTNLLLAIVALSLGILLSTFASSEFQMVQFIPLVVIPQVFFAGIIPLENMAEWLQALGRAMPLYYAADALKAVMYRGDAFAAIGGDLLVLAGFAALFIFLNVQVLKRTRKL